MHGTVAADSAIPKQRLGADGAADAAIPAEAGGTTDATTGEAAVVVDRPWRRALRGAVVFYLVSRVGLFAMTCFTWFNEALPKVRGVRTAVHAWTWQWDAGWFIGIAKAGYPRDSKDAAHAAFFPLYPYVTKAVAPLFFFNYGIAALVVANVALFGALVVLFRLTEHEFGVDSAGRTLFYLLAFPTGFFLSAAYNESMSIGLTVAAIYAMRRGHWWWAGVAGLFAATSRSAGILLVGAFVFEYVRQHGRRVRLDALGVLLIPAGLGVVMAIDQYYYHDALAFSHSQSAHWGRELTWPWKAIVDTIDHVVHTSGNEPLLGLIWTHNLLELSTVLLLIALNVLMLVGPWKVRRDQFVLPLFGLALIVFMISFPSTLTNDIPYPLLSTSRIGLEVFPAFMMLGRLGERRLVDRVLLVVLLPLQGIVLATFLHGGWVA